MGKTSNGPRRRRVAAPGPGAGRSAAAPGASDVPAQADSNHGAAPRAAAAVSSWRRWMFSAASVFMVRLLSRCSLVAERARDGLHRLGRLRPAGVEPEMSDGLGNLRAGQAVLDPAAQVGVQLV